MKEQIQNLIAEAKTVPEASLLVREYLQARILEALQRGGAFEQDNTFATRGIAAHRI